MVLMAVGDENTADAVPVLDEVGEVGNDHVHAVHIVIRKPHADVHHDDVAAILVHGEVLADLVETAQRNDLQFFCHNSSFQP